MDGTVSRVVIAGGGTAGWMCAAALGKFLPSSHTVTLVESEAIGTVGVGEATIPPLADFNHMLGIDENDFIRQTGGSFKLGIEFVDWARPGDRYFHPFSAHGLDVDGVPFHQHWVRQRAQGEPYPLDRYTIGACAARAGRFIRPNLREPDSPLAQIRHAYHIDAGRYATFLRQFAEALGVKRVEGRIVNVGQNDEGDIVSLDLEDGTTLDGDLFVDCTGFRALLVGDTLGADFEDWNHWLPCDRAFAVPSATGENFDPMTRATASSAGWRWRIPLQHRTGNGHVFSSAHISEDDARNALLDGLDTDALDEPRLLRFRAGRRREAWRRNCVAVGLSAGFLEPLESTSIHLIQEGVSRLLALFPRSARDHRERDTYNQYMNSLYDYIRDFVILHYHATERDDSDFWNDVRSMKVPDSLAERIALYLDNGRVFPDREDLFTTISWVAVMTGQRLIPESHDPLADRIPVDRLNEMMTTFRTVYREAADRMPPHAAFIERFCRMPDYAEAVRRAS